MTFSMRPLRFSSAMASFRAFLFVPVLAFHRRSRTSWSMALPDFRPDFAEEGLVTLIRSDA